MPRFVVVRTDEESDVKIHITEAPDWATALIESPISPYTAIGPQPVKPDEDDFDDDSGDYEEAFAAWQDSVETAVFTPASPHHLVDDDFDHGYVVRIVEIE